MSSSSMLLDICSQSAPHLTTRSKRAYKSATFFKKAACVGTMLAAIEKCGGQNTAFAIVKSRRLMNDASFSANFEL